MTIWTLRATIGQEKIIAKHIHKKIDSRRSAILKSIGFIAAKISKGELAADEAAEKIASGKYEDKKITGKQDEIVAETIAKIIKTKETTERKAAKELDHEIVATKVLGVSTLLIPEALRGYIFIEAEGIDKVDLAIVGIPHVRSKVVGEVEIRELEGFLVPKPTIEGLHVNDIIEIISGPFKGSRAKINRIDVGREEITVELLDSQIPIPIKLHSDFAKVIESAAGDADTEELTMVEGDSTDASAAGVKVEEEEEDVFSEFFSKD
ncbi:MAG: transcription elongation factor Spt5 [Candidatus Heimdallarchaeota archaeon]